MKADVGTIYLLVAAGLLIASTIRDPARTRGALEVTGKAALAVFPFAGFLRQSGAGYGACRGFVMSAMLIGVSTLPLELQTFGGRFTLTRNLLTFLLILALGVILMVVL